jgi:hypothetical protein
MASDPEGANPYLAPETGAGRPELPGGVKDRRTSLAVFGVFQILLGLSSLGMAILVPILQAVGASALGEEPRLSAAIPSVLVYGVLGGMLIALGAGSIRCRRWARNLTLVVSWAWLVGGILSLVGVAWLLPGFLSALSQSGELPEGAATVVAALLLGFLSVLLVVLPGILVAFYRSGSVRATCELIDPEPGWTEACPLPVLTASFWLVWTALFMAGASISARGTIPVFGYLATGIPGYLVYWAVAALWACGAFRMYLLQPDGWWLTTSSTILLFVSYAVSFLFIDPLAMYELMGYSQRELQPMKQMGFYTGRQFLVWIVLAGVPYVAYLIYLKKYFSSRTAV